MTPEPRTAVCFHGAIRTISPEIGYRLASLADGEGCFSISRRMPRSRSRGLYKRDIQPQYKCEFLVQTRADDKAFLSRMADATGLGTVYVHNAKPTPGRNNNPKARWSVHLVKDCVDLVRILDEYELWSKKRLDYLIWREAVIRWAGARVVEKWEWQRSFEALKAARRYEPVGVLS